MPEVTHFKNIQTGNSCRLVCHNGEYFFKEDWEVDGNTYIVVSGCDFEGVYYYYLIVNDVTVVSARDFPCIDDALSNLEDSDEAKSLKWYAPQTLGI